MIVTRDVAQDPAITDLIAHYDAVAAPIANRPIGTHHRRHHRTPNHPAASRRWAT